MKCLLPLVALLLVPLAGHAEPLQFVDEWTLAGQPAYGETRLTLATTLPEGVKTALPKTGLGTVRYSVLLWPDQTGKDLPVGVAFAGDAKPAPVLFVDADGDGKIAAGERAAVATSDQRPPGFGMPEETVWLATVQKPAPRTLALRRASVPGILACAVRGYLTATVPFGAEQRALYVVDANADLWIKPGADYAWLDVNGDGKQDTAERFFNFARIKTGQQPLRLAPGKPMVAAAWSPAPTGEAPITFRLGKLESGVTDLKASVTSDGQDVFEITDLDKPVTLPAGAYTIDALSAKATAADGSMRSYTFEGTGAPGFEVTGGQAATVDLIGKMAINVGYSGQAARGGTLDLNVTATSDTGLRLSACVGGDETAARSLGLIPPQIRFTDPKGKVLESGAMEFG